VASAEDLPAQWAEGQLVQLVELVMVARRPTPTTS
jgi:hypothetical protein